MLNVKRKLRKDRTLGAPKRGTKKLNRGIICEEKKEKAKYNFQKGGFNLAGGGSNWRGERKSAGSQVRNPERRRLCAFPAALPCAGPTARADRGKVGRTS